MRLKRLWRVCSLPSAFTAAICLVACSAVTAVMSSPTRAKIGRTLAVFAVPHAFRLNCRTSLQKHGWRYRWQLHFPGRRICWAPHQRHMSLTSSEKELSEWFAPDATLQGQLRALGRLLSITGDKLTAATAAAAAAAAEGALPCEEKDAAPQPCGPALRLAAEAMLMEHWAEARQLLGIALAECRALFPEDQCRTLQTLFIRSPSIGQLSEAFVALARNLEEHAAAFDTWESLQDALFDAAGTLFSAARIFQTPSPTPAPKVRQKVTVVDELDEGEYQREPRDIMMDIEMAMHEASPEQRKVMLRALAIRLHPDRHPGREEKVLPVFLYVQRLREEEDGL